MAMSLMDKARALRSAFSVPSEIPLPNAISDMSQTMSLPHKIEFHPLPQQVNALIELTCTHTYYPSWSRPAGRPHLLALRWPKSGPDLLTLQLCSTIKKS